MKKKSLFISVISLILVLALGVSAIALANTTSWSFDEDTNTLYIDGFGSMPDYNNQYSTPWKDIIQNVEKIIIAYGVTSVGDYCFAGAAALTDVSLPDSVEKIGEYAFASCSSLMSLTLGENVASIADGSFYYDGVYEKDDFLLNVTAGTYPLHYAVNNSIPFYCEDTACGNYTANIVVKGMLAYYPFVAPVSGKFNFYSTGNEDTIGYLYNADMRRLATNDDYSDANFRISYNLTAGETYYIAGRLYSAASKGSFGMVIEPDASLAINLDVNFDGWINAKDYAILTKDNSPLRSIFIYFLNTQVSYDDEDF